MTSRYSVSVICEITLIFNLSINFCYSSISSMTAVVLLLHYTNSESFFSPLHHQKS